MCYTNDMDKTNTNFETYRDEVFASTSYNVTEKDIREAYDEGVHVDDLIEWAEHELDLALFFDE